MTEHIVVFPGVYPWRKADIAPGDLCEKGSQLRPEEPLPRTQSDL